MKSTLKKKYVFGYLLGLCLAAVLLSQETSAQHTLILISNHDARLLVSGETHHITNQAKVRSGRTFPIEFQNHRIDVTIMNIGSGKYHARLELLERTDMGWFEISTDDLSYEAMYAAPIQYQWNMGDISLDLAMAVSVYQR